MKYSVVFNPKSGTALSLGLTPDLLEKRFREADLEALIDHEDGTLEDHMERALRAEADIVVCAGGDGTVTAVAQRLVGAGKPLAVIPLGTANLLARDLRIPLGLNEAIRALQDMVPTDIDVGELNGRIFMHSVVVGVIPSIAAARERVRGSADFTEFFGFARYVLRRLNNARRTAIAITSRDTQDRIERIHAIAVANNAYDQGWGKVFSRSSLNAGTLSLYILRRVRLMDFIRLGAKMAMGLWQEDEALTVETVRSVTLGSKRSQLSLMIDGELARLDTPLNFQIRPGALRVLAPPALSRER